MSGVYLISMLNLAISLDQIAISPRMKAFLSAVMCICVLSSCVAGAISRIDARLPIYYSWAVEMVFPIDPELDHFSIRIIPWRETSEVLLDAHGTVVHIREAKRSLWLQLRDILRTNRFISEDDLIKNILIVETTVSATQCAALAPVLESLRESYSLSLPDHWTVYADGPNYTVARTLEPF